MKRKIAAILAADVEGYSRLVAEDEEDALRRLASYRDVFGDFVTRAGGRVFNTAGDAVLAEFNSAVEATRCAIDIQESLRTRNLGYQPTRQMLFRIGLTIGDVVEREGDLLGDGVNVAARLQGLAPPGGICVSRSVFEQVAGKISVPFRDIGAQEVKNIPQPVHAFMVEMGGDSAARGRKARGRLVGSAARGSNLTLVLAAAGAAFGVAALGVVLLGQGLWRGQIPQTRPPHQLHTRPAIPTTATIAEAFAILARFGGVIADAKTVPELYHNARDREARGDPAGARRDYAALAEIGTDAIDPLIRYAGLLHAEGGRGLAREVFSRLARKGAPSVSLVYAMQYDRPERRARLTTFVKANPDFGPGHYMLAREFSAEVLGDQTLYDKRHEFDALDRFLDLDGQGKIAQFFIDQSMLAQWLDRARRSHAVLDAFRQTASAAPTAAFARTDAGWTVSLSLPEAATKVFYRVGTDGDFIDTGATSQTDPRSGKPVPKTTFDLPKTTRATVIEVRYDDMAGNAEGPFKISFDPAKAIVRGQREALERYGLNWLEFRSNAANENLVYYTPLVSYRCAIAKADFGFDGGPLSRTLALPKCDMSDPEAVPRGVVAYFPMPVGANSVSVQLTYFDGSRSDTRSFKHP